MKKPKALYICEGLGNGGTEKVMLNYIYNINRDNVEIEILILQPEIDFYVERLCRDGIIVNSLSGVYKGRKDFYFQVESFFQNHSYDIVHIHTLGPSYSVIGYYAKKYGCKSVIYHSHISNHSKIDVKFRMHKLFINFVADYKFACSKVAGKYMYYGKFFIVNNAIEVDRYAFNESYRREIRSKHGIDDNTLLLGNIGRLDKQKNQKYIIDIVSEMTKKNLDVKAIIVGTGELEQELRNYANTLNVQDKIIFALAQSEAHKYYSAFDVLVFPSVYEGLSLVLVEAQANGLPIVYSECLSEEAKMLENVVLLPNDKSDIDKWIESIVELNGKRINNSRNILVEKGFDIGILAKKIENLYIDIANNKKKTIFNEEKHD